MATEDKCDIIITMLEELKSSNKNQKSQQMDFSKIESLSEKLESSINAASDTTTKMKSITNERLGRKLFLMNRVNSDNSKRKY